MIKTLFTLFEVVKPSSILSTSGEVTGGNLRVVGSYWSAQESHGAVLDIASKNPGTHYVVLNTFVFEPEGGE